ncbi:hypothetical protein MCEMOH36_01242 [Candidatus Methylopumilus universalis]|uniref:hypothetical protein n=1 Tax=Candidatus Methylopumilus universalis TaxID=2588536 RepID=UPI003BEEF2B3
MYKSIISEDLKIQVNDIFSNLLLKENFNGLIITENDFYTNVVKQNESRDHYEECFNLIDPYIREYGLKLKKLLKQAISEKFLKNKICYFLPNIDNDLAHIQNLYNFLKEHDSASIYKFTIVGFSSKENGEYLSKLIKELEAQKKINVYVLSYSNPHNSLINFLEYFITNHYSLLIVYSIPLMLSAFIQCLGSSRVAWYSTKFKLRSFPLLKNRISNEVNICDPDWHQFKGKLNYGDKLSYLTRETKIINFLTINREEKILNLSFLESVKSILSKVENSTFSWTGRNQNEEIKKFFIENSLDHRVNYIGWVNYKDVLNDYDIFLDTPKLSGMVSAIYFASGMPVLSFKGSASWIENYIDEFIMTDISNLEIKELLSSNQSEYVNQAIKLGNSKEKRDKRSDLQKKLGARFYNTKDMYENHLAIIKNLTLIQS